MRLKLKKLVGWGLSSLIIAALIPFTPVQAQSASSRVLQSNLAVTFRAAQAEYQLQLTLLNTSRDQIVTSYTLPNFLGLKSLLANSFEPSAIVATNLDAKQLRLEIRSGLLPGQRLVAKFTATTTALHANGSIRYLRHGSLPEASNQDFQLQTYTVIYPAEWGEPLVDMRYAELPQLKKEEQFHSFEASSLPLLNLVWGESFTGSAKFKSEIITKNASSDTATQRSYLKPLLRESTTQSMRLRSFKDIKTIYDDRNGNVFGMLNYDNQQKLELETEIEVSFNPSNKTDPTIITTEGFIPLTIPSELHAKFPWFKETKQRLELASTDIDVNYSPLLNDVVLSIGNGYKVDELSWQAFAENLHDGSSKSLSYAQYTLQLLQVLNKLNIKASVVLLDRSITGGAVELLLEICINQCRYYDIGFNDSVTRLVSGMGLQLMAYDSWNQIVFEKIAQMQLLRPNSFNVEVRDSGVLGLEAEAVQPHITFDIPAEVKNFSNFSADVEVENNTEKIIFLDELRVAENHFPIADELFVGLHEGVLPGQSRKFQVKNVFLPEVFFSDKTRTSMDINLVYKAGGASIEYNSKQSILLSQNYFFWILLLVAIISSGLAVYAVASIVRQNKYLFLGGYWQLRRFLQRGVLLIESIRDGIKKR